MQNAQHQNAILVRAVENHVSAPFHTPQAGSHNVELPPEIRIFRQSHAAVFQFVQISSRLRSAPGLQRVLPDRGQVRSRPARENERRHPLPPPRGKAEILPNPPEHPILGYATPGALIDCGTQRS